MKILVTGAGRGIGYELVKSFAKDLSHKVVAVSRDMSLLTGLQSECEKNFGTQIRVYKIDFLSEDLEKEIDSILHKEEGHFDIVINNAGALVNKPFLKTTAKEVYNVFAVNVFAPIFLIKSLVRKLDPERKCHVINIGSMGGFQGSVKFPGLSIYSSSKSALANLTECLAEEFKDSNITFNCLALGSVQTEMLDSAFPGYQAQLSPEEAGEFIVEFSKNGSKFFNGKVIPISKSTP